MKLVAWWADDVISGVNMTLIAPRVSCARWVEVWGFAFDTGMALTTLRIAVLM